MPEDRSLDEFVTGSAGGTEDDTLVAVEPPADAASAADETGTVGSDDPVVEPVAETVDWTLDGAPCANCGEPARRRWRDGERLVCEACKDW